MYVGIDVSKRWFDVCTSPVEDAKTTRYPNDAEGFKGFIGSVKDLARKHHVCMEHTGGYEMPLALACKEAGFAVSIIGGGIFSDYRKSFGSAKAKTDLQDARLLSRYCKNRKPVLWYPLPDEYRTLRELVRHRDDLLNAKRAWACRSAVGVESELVRAHKKALVEVLRLQADAATEAIAAHVRAHDKLMSSLALLTSIPGIAEISAARILAESGPISGYPGPRDFALAAGLVPTSKGSGTQTPVGRLHVYGNRELRCALYFPTVVCYGHKIGVWEFMHRAESRGGKLKMTVITAGMRKLAHVVWGVLKHQQPYDHGKL